MKRGYSDDGDGGGGGEEGAEPEATPLKMPKEDLEEGVDQKEANLEIEEEDEELMTLGTESIPSPTSSESTAPDGSIGVDEKIVPIVMPKFMELKCGQLKGRLHTERFLCPGIREQCIEIDGCPTLLTPVEFTVKAEKSKQKDWKGAIKHDGRMLRTLMEIKQLDFYNHHVTCSYKCHSRNYITKNGGSAPKPTVPRVMPPQQKRRYSKSSPTTDTTIIQIQEELSKRPDIMAAFNEICGAAIQKRQEEVAQKMLDKQFAIKNLLEKEAPIFWRQTLQSKMSATVLGRISAEFGRLVTNLNMRQDFENSAQKLSQVIQILGLTDNICRELCGPFVMPPVAPPPPPSTVSVDLEEICDQIRKENNATSSSTSMTHPSSLPPQIPIQFLLPPPVPLFNNNNNNHNNNNNTILSSSEKLELMLKSIM